MEMITIDGKQYYVSQGTYPNNTTALELVDSNRQPYITVTVNAESLWKGNSDYNKTFAWPIVVIKNYSENEGIYEKLVTAGLITKAGAYIAGTDGKVIISSLTKKWQQLLKQPKLFK